MPAFIVLCYFSLLIVMCQKKNKKNRSDSTNREVQSRIWKTFLTNTYFDPDFKCRQHWLKLVTMVYFCKNINDISQLTGNVFRTLANVVAKFLTIVLPVISG